MSPTLLPPDQHELRADLFARIDAIAPTVAADLDRAEELRRLPDTTVEALRGAGLLALKTPRELGGFEAEPALQYEVFERLGYHSAPAAWCWFIYADVAGMITSRLTEAGLDLFLEDGRVPVACGGGGLRPGSLVPAPGGFLLSGKFRYGSGMHHSRFILLSGLLAGEGGARPRVLNCVVPNDDVVSADNWNVIGLKGTGSSDYTADGVFVPAELTFDPSMAPVRGGRQYRTGIVGYLAYTVPALCGALARRALDELTERAPTRMRGYAKPSVLAGSGAFQSFLGEADQKLKAARSLMIADGLAHMDHVDHRDADLSAVQASTRAAAAYAVRLASDVMSDTIRFAGGEALRSGQYIERAFRDLTMAASHQLVSMSAYENHAQFMLGIPGADPMG